MLTLLLLAIVVLLVFILLGVIAATTKVSPGRVEGPFSWLILLVAVVAVVWFMSNK